jgi:hypothetical protein
MGSLAGTALIVVGCAKVTSGTPGVDSPAAAAYRTSVSVSVSASISSSKSAVAAASCRTLIDTAGDTIDAVNDYVAAFNNDGDYQGKTQSAIDALNHSGDVVSQSVIDAVSPELNKALAGWVSATKAMVTAISNNSDTDSFNTAVHQLNDAKAVALALCGVGH